MMEPGTKLWRDLKRGCPVCKDRLREVAHVQATTTTEELPGLTELDDVVPSKVYQCERWFHRYRCGSEFVLEWDSISMNHPCPKRSREVLKRLWAQAFPGKAY